MKIKLKKKKNDSSNKWLTRHLNDEFYKKSKKDGFRSRASYKLIEINQKFQIFKNCKFILDLGCSPGGWTQVARRNSPKECKILGIDKLDLKEILFFKIRTLHRAGFFLSRSTESLQVRLLRE